MSSFWHCKSFKMNQSISILKNSLLFLLLPPHQFFRFFFHSATGIIICVVVKVEAAVEPSDAVGIVSMVSVVFRTFGIRRPIKICTSPVLIDLKTLIASACFIPCNDLPFTTSISSPRKEKKMEENG